MPSLSDTILAATGKKPLPEPEQPAVTNATTPQAIMDLAKKAAALTDKERAVKAEAHEARAELQEAMQAAQISEIDLDDRQINFSSSQNKSKTLKALKEILGDATGKKVWDALPTSTSIRLNVPKPNVDEPSE